MPLKESLPRANANTHEYSSMASMLAKHSSQYNSSQFITIHHNTMSRALAPTKRHKKADMVWRCVTMSDNVWQCQNAPHHVWHDLLSQALWSSAGGTIDEAELSAPPLPVTSAPTALASTPPAKLCVHSAKVKVWHVTRNLLDWCSDVFWQVVESLLHQHEFTRIWKKSSINV